SMTGPATLILSMDFSSKDAAGGVIAGPPIAAPFKPVKRQMTTLMPSPAVILSHPQMGENVGAAARAMKNFGLGDLRLVAPRDGWPNEKATAMAAGAADIVEAARIFETTEAALADLQLVYATTARERGFAKAVLTPAAAATRLREAHSAGHQTGILFGGERSGLDNHEVSLATA